MLLVVAMVGAIILVRPSDGGGAAMIGLEHVLVVGALLFSIGLYVALSRRNAVGVLMGVELMLNSVNLNLVGFSRFVDSPTADRRAGVRRVRDHGRGGRGRGGAALAVSVYRLRADRSTSTS